MLWSAAAHIALFSVLSIASPSREVLDEVCAKFTGFDRNGDGVVEIAKLDRLPSASAGEDGARVLVLVEDRLLQPLDNAPAIAPYIDQLTADLANEGYRADALAVQLGQSDLHQDGQYLLAIRDLLRATNDDHPLAGVLLVGRFPDAFIVRTCNWRKNEQLTLHKGTDEEKTWDKVRFVRRVPEGVAYRGDIVLADFDGRWEDIYSQPKSKLRTVYAVYPECVPAHGGPCVDIQIGSVSFEDFFHVSDGKLEIAEISDASGNPAGYSVSLFDRSGDHECSNEDRTKPNVIAHPDIMVSRIDARGVAMRPKRSIVGVDGHHLLDENGKPQTVQFASKDDVPHWRSSIWEFDPQLERQLLAEFFERDHSYRAGECEIVWRPSSIACGLGSGFRVMQRAAEDWEESDRSIADLNGHPTLAQFIDWAEYPAVLRTLRAHSDEWGSVFGKCDTDELDARLGGPAWSWTPKGDQLVPSLSAACRGGKLDWYLLRSMWEYGLVAREPSIYLHTGCHGISPAGATNRPFDSPSYGGKQGGEAILFFANGLALVGRSKVFYDEPKGFAEALGDGATVGEAWARYFEIESQAASWGKAGGDIGRKRSYFWAVLGDWTIRLQRPGSRDLQAHHDDSDSHEEGHAVSR